MSAVIQDRAGSITRTNAGEVDFKLFMYKDRKKKTTKEGDADLSSFVRLNPSISIINLQNKSLIIKDCFY